jgi:hypothetical protein
MSVALLNADGVEGRCGTCGRRSRDKTGTCRSCREAAIPKLASLSTEHVIALAKATRHELERRQREILAALKEPKP